MAKMEDEPTDAPSPPQADPDSPHQPADTDMELSDCPDDLSDWSAAQDDELRKPKASLEIEVHARAEQDDSAEQAVQIEPDSQMEGVEQPTARSPDLGVMPVQDHNGELQEKGLLSPPHSPDADNESQLLQAPSSATSDTVAISRSRYLPSPTPTPRRKPKPKPKLKAASHTTPIRKSTRIRQTPARFPGIQFESQSPVPTSETGGSLDEATSDGEAGDDELPEAKVVTLKLRSDLLAPLALRPLPASTTPVDDVPAALTETVSEAQAETVPEALTETIPQAQEETILDTPPATQSKRKLDPQSPNLLPRKTRRLEDFEHDAHTAESQYMDSTGRLSPEHTFQSAEPAGLSRQIPSVIDYNVGDEIWALGRQLMSNAETTTNKSRQASQLEPSGQPPVWANLRFALCETIPNCLSYQSSSYTYKGMAYSYIFGGECLARGYIDNDVVIARAPGDLRVNKKSGERYLAKDQTDNAETEAFKNAMKAGNPVVLITKSDNTLIPSRVPHPYCVMGHFKPTEMWWEKLTSSHGSKVSARFRFERVDAIGGNAWYHPKDQPEPMPLGSLDPPNIAWCVKCRKPSKQRYCNGWICFHKECEAFWKLPAPQGGLHEVAGDSLVYDPRFLNQKTSWPTDGMKFPLEHNAVQVSEHTRPDDLYTKLAWKGIVCPQCRGCIMRLKFSGYRCETHGCGYERNSLVNIFTASSIVDPTPSFPRDSGYTMSRDISSSAVRVAKPLYANNYRMNRFDMLGAGFVVHAIANETICKEPGGPDDMLVELQRVDVGLERRPLGAEKLQDPSFTRHMNFNVGMYYKFAATGRQKTVSFEDVKAQAVRDTRTRLNWQMVQILARDQNRSIGEVAKEWEPNQFNEELILGYFEDQSIGYHDDGEPGLGPNVATLSLGDTGKMTIRMKAAQYYGRTAGGIYDHKNPPIPGCKKYEERLLKHDEIVRNAPATGTQAYFKKAAEDLGLDEFGTTGGPIVLEMSLRHGDQVFMVGGDIQTYYEHSVSHEGRIRFALTCRTIDPNSIHPENRPDFEVGPDPGQYDGTKLPLPCDVAGNPIPNGWQWEYPEEQ